MNKEAEWLLEEKYSGEKTEGFFTDLKRLESNEPLGYVIGHVPFLNTTIYLDSHPLIPRAETEFWVEGALQKIREDDTDISVLNVLDLCAGSGCVGVTILKNLDKTSVDFVEIDESHHRTIKKNIAENAIDSSRTRVLGGDLFSSVNKTYDYILTNPPYIDPSLDRTQSSVKEYEPEKALYGGKGGMELITRIIQEAKFYLKKNGTVYMEHEPEQKKTIVELATQNGYLPESFADQFGIIRYTRFKQTS